MYNEIVLQVIQEEVKRMPTISFRMSEEEAKQLHEYVKMNNLNLSQFVRESVLDRIDSDLKLDEERILHALNKSKEEKLYDHMEVWDILEV